MRPLHELDVLKPGSNNFLREARGCAGLLPATLGFLPPRTYEQHPALISAFWIPGEPEPGILGGPNRVDCVHLTLLKPGRQRRKRPSPRRRAA